MEVLNLLENRVVRLLEDQQRLQEEHQRLFATSSGGVAEFAALQDENRRLRDALAQERQLKEDLLKRIDALLGLLDELENTA